MTGLLVAYAMNPAVRGLEKWGISRPFGTTLMILAFFIIIGVILIIAIPFIQTELLRLASRVPQYGDRLLKVIQPILDEATQYIQPNDVEKLRSFATSYTGDVITWGIRVLANILSNSLALANLISLIVITPIVAFYFLRDWNRIIQTIDNLLPRPYEPKIKDLFLDINETIGGYAKGQALVCLILAIYYSIALSIAGLDFSLVVGPLVGIMAFIPYVGALVGFMLSIGIAFSQFSDWHSVALIAGIFAFGQTTEGYLLIPYLVGDRIGLHPVWVIFALLAGGVLYGFIGILFALPVGAACGVLVRHLIKYYRTTHYYLGRMKEST
jgi:predicted PurR-regulated permease PerM